jgi:lipopolysaccharide biosynthesis glycosyltransferase
MRTLAYYTVGYKSGYLQPIAMSIQSLRIHNPSITVWVLCDENLIKEARTILPEDVVIVPRPRIVSPETAFMIKLSICDDDLSSFDKVIYIDADILINIDISPILAKVQPRKLYAYKERNDIKWHGHIYWSLSNYTEAELEYFRVNNIYPFNTGLFAFVPSNAMKWHFEGVRQMIRTHRGPFFTEQSFMNVYFNKRNLVDYSLFTDENYNMGYMPLKHIRMILHFAGHPGSAADKIRLMTNFAQKFMPYLLAGSDGSEKLNTVTEEIVDSVTLSSYFPLSGSSK